MISSISHNPLPYPQGYTSHDARSATGPQPPVGTEPRWVPRRPPRSTGVQHRRGSPAKQDDQRPDRLDDGPTGLPGDFERLRWFHLPPACLSPRPACLSAATDRYGASPAVSGGASAGSAAPATSG